MSCTVRQESQYEVSEYVLLKIELQIIGDYRDNLKICFFQIFTKNRYIMILIITISSRLFNERSYRIYLAIRRGFYLYRMTTKNLISSM